MEGNVTPHQPNTIAAGVIIFFCCLAFVLNFCVLLTMGLHAKLRVTTVDVIHMNLSSASLLMSTSAVSSQVYAMFYGWDNGYLCQLYGFVMTLSGLASITSFTVLAVETTKLVRYPTSPPYLSKTMALLLVWAYAIVFTVPAFYVGGFGIESSHLSCSVRWRDHSRATTVYILVLMSAGHMVPAGIITVSYFTIYWTRRSSRQRNNREVRGHTTGLAAIMVATFYIAWTPYAIVSTVQHFWPRVQIHHFFALWPAVMAKCSTVLHPALYMAKKELIWSTFLSMFRRRRVERDALELR